LCGINKALFQKDQIGDMNLTKLSGTLPPWKLIKRGIYIFLGQNIDTDNAIYSQIVRVGTHSVKSGGSKSTIWGRLRQHKGNIGDGGGNHRGSIFRLLVGDAVIRKEGLEDQFPDWGVKRNAPKSVRKTELPLEQRVSKYIRQLPCLVIKVDPETNGPRHRGYLERNMIALLSQIQRNDTQTWLGEYSSRAAVRDSKLWNNNHTDEQYDPEFLNLLEYYIKEMENI